MRISASQDETFTMCHRKWWFSYPQKLPSIAKGDLDFGSVIHNVCERYLLADDTGRVPPVPYDPPDGDVWLDGPLKGQYASTPVELYPKGWDTLEDKKGKRTIAPVNADLIKRLVQKAIDEGVLERRPDREVELWFERDLIPGVQMVGKIDMMLPGEVQDHKSTKAMKWAKSEKKDSPNYLGKSLQMLDYAHEALARDPSLEVVRLRHNVFCKDPEKPIVRKVDVTVTRAVVAANWQRLKKQGWEMQVLEAQKLTSDKWKDVPGPQEVGACEAFGGCPYVRICGGVDDPEKYRTRVTKQIERKETLQDTYTWADVWGRIDATNSETDDMNVFDKSKARQKARKASVPIDNSTVAPTKPIDGSVATIEEPMIETPNILVPAWAQPNCPACKGIGFNKKGSPCRICDATSKKLGGRTSLEFVIDTDGEGNIVWEAKDGSSNGSASLSAVEPRVQEKMELPAAPLDTPEPQGEETQKDIMGALDEAAAKAAEQAAADVTAEAAKKATKVIDGKPKKPRKPRKPKAPKAEAEVERIETTVFPPDHPEDVQTSEEVTAPPTPADTEDVPTSPEEEELIPQAPAKAKGRPKAGFYLYIDCMPIGFETVAVETLFTEMSAELAAEMKVDSYFDLDVYKRRESFARVLTAEVLTERFNKMHIVARNPQGAPDLRAFVDAIISVASKGRVIQGVR